MHVLHQRTDVCLVATRPPFPQVSLEVEQARQASDAVLGLDFGERKLYSRGTYTNTHARAHAVPTHTGGACHCRRRN